jgi:hypothetical protein
LPSLPKTSLVIYCFARKNSAGTFMESAKWPRDACGRGAYGVIGARAAAIGLVVLGAILRICGARGDLWLDEIWSLALLKPVRSFATIIWGINHDNNHVLNSIYLYLVGPDAPPIILRGLAIALGIGSVIAAGLALRRSGIVGALAAMLLFAVSYPMVNFGSEARGYAGLILFSLVALFFLQREFSSGSSLNRHCFGVAIGFGLLSHLSMVISAVAFGLWTLFVTWRRTANVGKALLRSFIILFPALALSIAVALTVGFAALRYGFVVSVESVPGKFAIGGINPFGFISFINSYGELLRLTVGLPDSVPNAACLAGAIALIGLSVLLWRDRNDNRSSLYVISVILLPAAALAAHLSNTSFPRYFLVSGTMFLLFIADSVNRAWLNGGLFRLTAAICLVAIVGGNTISLFHFLSEGRGNYVLALKRMTENGGIIYASDHNFRTSMVVNYYSHRLGVFAKNVAGKDWCREPPHWYIIENPDSALLAYDEFEAKFPACALRLRRTDLFPYWGLSGRQWVLYRVDYSWRFGRY